MRPVRIAGVFTTLITPFRDEALDEPALATLIERQITAGVQGLVVASGFAAEAATLARHEVRRAIELCVKTTRGRVPVIAGASSNSTSAAIALARLAQEAGADAALVTAPWYNRPSQDGIYRHFQAIAETVQFPLIVGNAPQRTTVDVLDATLARLFGLPNVIGVEDGSGDVARVSSIRRSCGSDFVILSSHDATGLGAIAHGAHGWASLSANVAPQGVTAMYAACATGDWPAAREWQDRLFDLHRTLSLDPVPSAVKFALSTMDLCKPDVRLPITRCSATLESAVLNAIREPHLDL